MIKIEEIRYRSPEISLADVKPGTLVRDEDDDLALVVQDDTASHGRGLVYLYDGSDGECFYLRRLGTTRVRAVPNVTVTLT